MIGLYKQDGETLYGIKDYIVDTEADVANLSTNIKPGSTAFVIETSVTYMLNNEKKWVALKSKSDNNDNSTVSGDDGGNLYMF